jgi:cell division protein ZapA
MADVELEIGGRLYTIACRDGGEDHLRTIAQHVDKKAAEARSAVGDATESRQLLFAALLLADEIAEMTGGGSSPPASTPDPQLAGALSALATRIEAVADTLERA